MRDLPRIGTRATVATAMCIALLLGTGATGNAEGASAPHAVDQNATRNKQGKGSPANDVLYFIERLVPLTSRAVTFRSLPL